MPRLVLVIPLLWSLVGFSAVLSLGIAEDNGLLIAGLLATGLLPWRDRSQARRCHAARSSLSTGRGRPVICRAG